MNFFEHQDRAQRRTKRLVVLFILAVVAIVLGVYSAFTLVFYLGGVGRSSGIGTYTWWRPSLFAWVSLGTLAVISFGSLYKTRRLSGGGASVATMLGGTAVPPNTTDLKQRRLLNVVEEMAIASGLPVPDVYILQNEPGINAFAAGFNTSDAVLGVTRGTLDTLNRDELQGVIGHEFSHILNGDMRLNIRLMGILHGILVIGLTGYLLLRVMGRTRVRGRGAGAVILVALVLGLTLLIVGYIGVFFGRLIQSGVSRQREYLADASSVQFTRNPDGLSSALKKIGGSVSGSRMISSHSREASHFFFGNALRRSLFGLLATHPPLVKRIRAIDPHFDGEFEALSADYRMTDESPVRRLTGPLAAQALPSKESAAPERVTPPPTEVSESLEGRLGVSSPTVLKTDDDQVVARVGRPSPDHVAYSEALLDSFPPLLSEAVREPFGAQAVVFCSLLDPNEEIRRAQLDHLEEHIQPAIYRETDRLAPYVDRLGPAARLPLVDLCLPALRRMSLNQYNRFADNLRILIEADQKIDLFEYTLQRILLKHLRPAFERPQRRVSQFFSPEPLTGELALLLSTLARVGHDNEETAKSAFRSALAKLKLKGPGPAFVSADPCRLPEVDTALERIALANPGVKQRVIRACAHCVAYDGKVTLAEAELLRAVADTLDCPIPPFLPRN